MLFGVNMLLGVNMLPFKGLPESYTSGIDVPINVEVGVGCVVAAVNGSGLGSLLKRFQVDIRGG